MQAKKLVSDLVSEAGVAINGEMPWDIQVHEEKL